MDRLMKKYIFVYKIYFSYYNLCSGEEKINEQTYNFEIDAFSKKEAYDKFKEYAKDEVEKIRQGRYQVDHKKEFVILNIICLESESE